MARPIEPTPVLTGKDAEEFLKEVSEVQEPSPETLRNLEKCVELFHHFYKRKRKLN